MKKQCLHSAACHGGYSLLEMLVYVAIFGVIVNLCVTMFVSTSRLSAYTTLALDRLNGAAELEAGFRAAVEPSAGVLPEAGGHLSNDNQIVLRLAPVEGLPAFRVYGLLRDESRLSRMDFLQKSEGLEVLYLKTFPQRVKHVRLHGGAEGEAIRLEFELLEEAGERPGQARVFTVAVAPRLAVGGSL